MTTDELIARARNASRNAEWGMSRTEWTSAIWVLERLADALEDEAAGRGLAERKLQRAMEVLGGLYDGTYDAADTNVFLDEIEAME